MWRRTLPSKFVHISTKRSFYSSSTVWKAFAGATNAHFVSYRCHQRFIDGQITSHWSLTRHFSSIRISAEAPELTTSTTSSSLPFTLARRRNVRNVAVIAHVDHGKTSLVDKLLSVASVSAETQQQQYDRLLDSSDLEKERGITITSKVTRLTYHNDDDAQEEPLVINCVDTPGHADFSGEVDRILSMVDAVVLLVDAAEGPKSQTKYVLSRALAMSLNPIVVLNKCDRPDAIAAVDSGETEEKIEKLFQALSGRQEKQFEFTTLYASAREGWATLDPIEALELAEHGYQGQEEHSMKVLLDVIRKEVPEPSVRSIAKYEVHDGEAFSDDPFSLAAVTVGYDQYLGRTCTGRIVSGSIAVNDSVTILKREKHSETSQYGPTASILGVFVQEGIRRVPLAGSAYAGDIVTLAGVPDSIAVGDTVTSASNPVEEPIETPPLAPPTLAVDFGANNGPLAGTEGTKIASSQIKDRLFAETDNNVTLKVKQSETDVDKTTVYARGELQMGILMETMRREGFEFVVTPPRILMHECADTGKMMEPFEEVTVDVDSEYSSTVVSALTGDRKGVLIESDISSDGKSRLLFEVPSRGLLGFNSEIATATRGSAVVNHLFLEYREYAGNLGVGLEKGKLVSNQLGKATAYALESISQRGTLFIAPADQVYPGLIIGENAKPGDLEVNPVRAKELTNMRTQSKDEKIFLAPPRRLSVEELIGYMGSDEVIEVTPQSVRLRKELLDNSARERAARNKAKQLRAQKTRQ